MTVLIDETVKERVRELLKNYSSLRDDCRKTQAIVWAEQMGLSSYLENPFLARYAQGDFSPAETIRRPWQELQRLHPELAGENRKERTGRIEKKARQEIREWSEVEQGSML
jgi:hypothetical protein